jgi:hypothetical protein
MGTEITIHQLNTTYDTVSAEALLTPALVERIAAAVLACARAERIRRADRDADIDTRSVVEQQRAGRR